ncbi:YihY/virulence factor BrkB family protein, partial [Mycobacterium sp. ITM-2017-0098]
PREARRRPAALVGAFAAGVATGALAPFGRPRSAPEPVTPAQREESTAAAEPAEEDESFDEPVNPPEPDDARKPDSPTDLTRPSM